MKKGNPKHTILIIAAGFTVLFFLTKRQHWYFPAIAATVMVAGFSSKVAAFTIHRFWLRFGEVMGAVSSRILLTFLFIFILTPLALLYRLFRKKNRSNKTEASSYFVERNRTYTPGDLQRLW
ncbi:MAG: SxtJ family membrane protein [Chitinophagales bacterium]